MTMEYKFFSIFQLVFCFLPCYEAEDSYFVEINVTWNIAKSLCEEQNNSLVTIKDLQNISITRFSRVWSSLKESNLTPWIASIGCFNESVLRFWSGKKHVIENNTVGKCYQQCHSNENVDELCRNENFFFGLRLSSCLCICKDVDPRLSTYSLKCDISCLSSVKNGYCGGRHGFVSVYKADTRSYVEERRFGGFCLTCSDPKTANPILFTGEECDNPNNGICMNNDTEDYCYSIENTAEDEFFYKKRNCTEELPFICRLSTSDNKTEYITGPAYTFTQSSTKMLVPLDTSVLDHEKANLTTTGSSLIFLNTTSVSNGSNSRRKDINTLSGTVGMIVALCISILIIACVSIILFLCLKRRWENAALKIANDENTRMNEKNVNTISNNCFQPEEACTDDVYVEKAEGEYDNLHNRRTKQKSGSDPQYDSASGWDDCYSSTSREQDIHQDNCNDNDYSVMPVTQDNYYATCNCSK